VEPLTALLIVPLLLWAGLFAFIWFVDARVRALERRLNERQERLAQDVPAVRKGPR
jgi:hypothetical protein